MKRILLIVPLLMALHGAEAQHCFARVQLDRRSVYVQQPFKVTITVLTDTWYTAPIEFDNLQVPNAFVLPFDKTMPGMFDHNGKQYAGIQFYFIVFPYKAGKFSIPAITVHATTPPEGSSESKRITIKTPVQQYTVKSIPNNIEGSWFVAKSVSIHENWNKPLSHLKVGDVIERTVTIRARGTLPQFIPALTEKTLAFANVYPQDPELKDMRDEYDANGELTQSFTYLLEKEGDFTIPPMPVQWWNPNAGKMNSRTLPKHTLHVNANPDLGMVATLQDSLAATQKTVPVAKAKQPLRILGVLWYWFAAYSLAALIILNVLIRLLIKIIKSIHKKSLRYRASEAYWFRRLMRSPGELIIFWQRLYQWWDLTDKKNRTTDIRTTSTEYANVTWHKDFDDVNAKLYHKEDKKGKTPSGLKKQTRVFRHWLYQQGDNAQLDVSERQKEWLR